MQAAFRFPSANGPTGPVQGAEPGAMASRFLQAGQEAANALRGRAAAWGHP